MGVKEVAMTFNSLTKLSLLTAFIGALAPSVVLAQSAPNAKTCLFYEHFDFEGKHFGLHTGHILTTAENVPAAKVYSGGKDFQRFVSTEWAGRVSSLKVPPNCIADVFNGTKSVPISADLPRFSDEFHDKSTGFGCRCK